MKRVFCDRCGVGITDRPAFTREDGVHVIPISRTSLCVGIQAKDLCDDCDKELLEWFRSKASSPDAGRIELGETEPQKP